MPWGGHLPGGGSPPGGGVWRQAGEAGCCHFGWGRVVARVGAGRNGYLGADEARPLVTDMLQGGSDVNLLHSWVGGVRGCSGGVQRRVGPRKPRASWGGRLGGLKKAWGCGNPPSRNSCDPGDWGDSTQRLGCGRAVGGGVVTFCHAVQYHVDEDVGASPSCTVTERGDGDRLSLGPSRNREGRGRLVELLGLAGDGVGCVSGGGGNGHSPWVLGIGPRVGSL